MRIEPAEQFIGATARSLRLHGYGDSAEALIEEYAPLVRKIAWQVFSRVSRTGELDDLIQTGLIALIEASRQYEERGFAFSTYATTRIRGAMIDQLRLCGLTDRVTVRSTEDEDDGAAGRSLIVPENGSTVEIARVAADMYPVNFAMLLALCPSVAVVLLRETWSGWRGGRLVGETRI